MIYTKEIIEQKRAQKRKRKKIISTIVLPFIVIMFFCLIYMGYLKLVKKDGNISFLGYRQYIVLTGSMVPNYNIGDLVIDKKINKKDIKLNDVVTFVEKESGTIITHRIIEFVEEGGKTLYRTKGDNNDSPDPNLIEYEQIQGKVIRKISNFGNFINKVVSKTGIIFLIIIFITFYMHTSKREEKIYIREEARRKYNLPKYKKEEIL